MSYGAPVGEMLHTLRHVAGFDHAVADGLYGDLDAGMAASVLEEAARFADDVIAPINRGGDTHPARFDKGLVTMPPGWKEAYAAWIAAGWNALSGPEAYGGQGLPLLLGSACTEMWNAASMAFGVGPLLTAGGIEALAAHGAEDLKARYLAPMVSGAWPATMNLTEPQAGSDLAALRARAERAPDGSYRVTGQKIYITYGEHDLSDNIVHFVLARLPDAPVGTRGISLFLVPKILPDGSRNDLRCGGIEHKLGLHGSPTCTMIYGDGGGATGWIVGAEHRGLACMFTMMNNARLGVGLQGVGIAERATQHALAYARERRQGRAGGTAGEGMSPIVAHPDVQRMLLTMKALTAAARGICYLTAEAIDRARLSADAASRSVASERAGLLTPVAKAFSTDIGIEVASLGIQVHGGMGYIEEAGAAQHLRDARIAAIYEGTNGIQAIDLVTRKLPLSGGGAIAARLAAIRLTQQRLVREAAPAFGLSAARLREGTDALDRATGFLLRALRSNRAEEALAGATPYLRLFGLVQGGACLAEAALASGLAPGDAAQAARIHLCRFFMENLVPAAPGLAEVVMSGGGFAQDAGMALAI